MLDLFERVDSIFDNLGQDDDLDEIQRALDRVSLEIVEVPQLGPGREEKLLSVRPSRVVLLNYSNETGSWSQQYGLLLHRGEIIGEDKTRRINSADTESREAALAALLKMDSRATRVAVEACFVVRRRRKGEEAGEKERWLQKELKRMGWEEAAL